jgi:hypothetical protein
MADEELKKRKGETPTKTKVAPKTTKTKSTTPVSPTETRTVTPTAGVTDWFYFIDSSSTLEPDVEYQYKVIIYCKNPIDPKKYPNSKVQRIVENDKDSTEASNPVKIEAFRQWYFTGGAPNPETGTFRVRVYVGGKREISQEEVDQILAELEGTGAEKPIKKKDTTTAKKGAEKKTEESGVWLEENFTARPGEEIGGKKPRVINGEKREIDFSTGCQLVSIEYGIQVVEDRRTLKVAGKTEPVERIQRLVNAQKLRVHYIDHLGNLKSRWQEAVPTMPSGTP